MAYTVSFDASVKLQSGDVPGFVRRIARDVAGIGSRDFSDPDIDPERTHLNRTFVLDADGGSFVKCENAGDIVDAVDDLLKRVKRTLRKDAVVMRPLVVQLDPKWYEERRTEEEVGKSIDDMLSWVDAAFGFRRCAYISLHMDEGAPHVHIGFVPVTNDGRLSQNDFFPNSKVLRGMHMDLRMYMASRGYDIDMDGKTDVGCARRLNESDYRGMIRDRRTIDDESERRFLRMEREVRDRMLALDERERKLAERECLLAYRERILGERENIVRRRECDVQDRERRADMREMSGMISEERPERDVEGAVR